MKYVSLSVHVLHSSSLTCTGANQHHLFMQLCPDVKSIHLQDQRDACVVTVWPIIRIVPVIRPERQMSEKLSTSLTAAVTCWWMTNTRKLTSLSWWRTSTWRPDDRLSLIIFCRCKKNVFYRKRNETVEHQVEATLCMWPNYHKTAELTVLFMSLFK